MDKLAKITGINSKHAEGNLKECIDNITEESLAKARKQLEEESVSEELREAARKYFKSLKDDCFISSDIILAFKAGANWQAEQFEKNRLAACDRQTEEEAEIERDFCMGIIEKEHRQPTFDDAIKYGYHKAEKDLELTWEDMEVIQEIANNYTKYHTMEPRIFVYKEILKRFNERREK